MTEGVNSNKSFLKIFLCMCYRWNEWFLSLFIWLLCLLLGRR